MEKTALVILAEGFEEMEAVISIDILRRAGVVVTVVSLAEDVLVKGSRNITIKADSSLAKYSNIPDALVLPGGTGGAERLAVSVRVAELIADCNEKNKIVAAICAAPAIVLAKSGVLDNKKATCYPEMEQMFGESTVFVEDDVVCDGNIITSRGAGTAFDFALAICEKLRGDDIVLMVRKGAVIA